MILFVENLPLAANFTTNRTFNIVAYWRYDYDGYQLSTSTHQTKTPHSQPTSRILLLTCFYPPPNQACSILSLIVLLNIAPPILKITEFRLGQLIGRAPADLSTVKTLELHQRVILSSFRLLADDLRIKPHSVEHRV